MSAECTYNKVIKLVVESELSEPMHVGSAEGDKDTVLIHPVTGMPYVQATSIAGAMREYYEEIYKEEAELVFGTADKEAIKSRIKIEDGVFKDVEMEIRPRVKINPETGCVSSGAIKGSDSESGHKFQMEQIGAGAKLSFSIYLFEEEDSFKEHVIETINAFNKGYIQIGGQKSNGCGDIRVKNIYQKEFDLKTKEGRIAWINESEDSDFKKVNLKVNLDKVASKSNLGYRIKIKGEVEGNILVKAIFVKDSEVDAENIRNAKGEYIIPGSALKGVFRNRMQMIADYIGEEDIIENIFGKNDSDKNEDNYVGNVRFFDTVIGDKETNDKAPIENHIKIDKFTGGTIYGSLFNEKSASGKVEIRIDILDKNDKDKSLALLLLAIRDLELGLFNVGSGYSIGKGFFDIESVKIQDKDKEYDIKESKEFVKTILGSLGGGR